MLIPVRLSTKNSVPQEVPLRKPALVEYHPEINFVANSESDPVAVPLQVSVRARVP